MSTKVCRATCILFTVVIASLTGRVAHAQNLGWEGETGVFITPLASTAASPSNGLGRPVVAYHFLDAGSVVGTFSQVSVTEGIFGRVEFGYTRNVHSTGDDARLSPLWHSGFNIVHGKVNIVRENTGKHNWIPAFSGGFILRSQVHNVGGAITGKDTTNADVYIVATKTIPIARLRGLPLILSGGVRGTNAELFGLAGNAPDWKARAFGVVGFALKGPAKSALLFAVEASQQPRHPEGLPAAVIPTTLAYAFRLLPSGETSKLNIDLGVAQLANQIMPGVELKARHQFGMGISYRF